ncbi:MAG: histidine--tRNA ligase [Oscillospiraceae bacterium]|nr:histidine--tRNA ligase [Oscillospiraceae bacterium]
MQLLTKAPKGTHDILDCTSWQWLEALLRDTARLYGYSEIRTPMIEHTELFERGAGETTDVVQKEMYTLIDKGGRSITMRPEGTAGVCRAMLEHSLLAQGLPQKVYYIGPNFRYERPQAGRLRQHHQFGVECFGPAGADADAELIALADAYLQRIGIAGVTLEINSIGCPDCRPIYHSILKEYLAQHDLCGLCEDRIQRNPLRILDCKNPDCQAVAANAPYSADHLCIPCHEHFESLKAHLSALGIAYTLNKTMVRGFDYYTRTVFEFKVAGSLGAQNTVCGGGRYDGLIETLGGPPTPALGFGSGIERLLLTAQAQGIGTGEKSVPDVCIVNACEDDAVVTVLTHELRGLGVAAVRDVMGRKVKAQMKQADKIKARYVVVIGDDEVAADKVQVKDMADGSAVECALDAAAICKMVL